MRPADPDGKARRGGTIEIVGARTHNLKGVSVSIPVGALTVITGPSGSGKSSLAFDTLYAEGQRRFVESMSTYARQFLERMERPDVDSIDHVLPAIAIQQKASARSARSTVGTATEIDDVMRLLFASIGQTTCLSCGDSVGRHSPESVAADLLATWGDGARLMVAVPRPLTDAARESREWLRGGYLRVLDPTRQPVELTDGMIAPAWADGRARLVVGRHVLHAPDAELMATLASAFELGAGEMEVVRADGERPLRRYHRALSCRGCGRSSFEPTPALFSFNSPRGACPACEGFGRIVGIDPARVVPDPALTLDERPIAPFNSPAYESAYDEMLPALKKHRVRRNVPWEALSAEERDVVWAGRGSWYGVEGLFKYFEKKRYKLHVRVLLARYRGYTTCTACAGARLAPEALAVRIAGKNIAELGQLPLDQLDGFLRGLDLSDVERARGGQLVDDVVRRVTTLIDIGLPYLTLARTVRTLSGGEAQRIQLGSAIGSSLTGTLYVLDEPTVGLHPRDTDRLLVVLRRLAAGGNAVVVVEHDLEVIRAADHVIDLGPHAGRGGGNVVFAGPPERLAREQTATGRALAGAFDNLAAYATAERPGAALCVAERRAPRAKSPRSPASSKKPASSGRLRIVNARAHNLKNVSVDIPLGVLVCVAGVSGSGKSSLVVDVLAAGVRRALGKGISRETDEIGAHDRIEGIASLADVELVDQAPLGRSARSNPATYTKAWDEIRALYARTHSARALGLTKGSFSFNVEGGRCATCEGSGVVSIDMQFLADVTIVCEECDGKRFTKDVLGVRLRGRNVAELLDTTVDEARELFADVPPLVARLTPLSDAGLGYLRLGQSTATLSGGEAQRLKVVSYLAGGGAAGCATLFIFDEPTTGLHPMDVSVLLEVFGRLLRAGHSIVAVEHNPTFLMAADHVIELGPEGGDRGGQIVFEGSVATMLESGATATAEALRVARSPVAATSG
ncbi:MAG: excinuclease ABC subunit UvrA [Thermoanaerobaculia bacterium]